jgi:agmatinase
MSGPPTTPVPPCAVLGVPIDANSSHLRGCAGGPDAIRSVLRSGAGNGCTEAGVDVVTTLLDVGDVAVTNAPGSAADADRVTGAVAAQLDAGRRVICLGGDHSITYPALRAYGVRHRDLTVVHVDAHPDLYADFEGNPLSHASPFARALEAGCVRRLVQVGIRTATPHQREQAARWGVETVPPRALGDLDHLDQGPLVGPVYVTIDLDGLDPSIAPGVSHHEPGGLTVREVLDLIDALPTPVVGADVVELNPSRDVVGMTAAVGAKLVKELAGAMAR